MTPDEATRQKALREAAQRDILDIEALSKSEAFNRYFVGQINRLYKESIEQSLTEKTVEDREKARVRAVLLRELTEMPGKHRLSAEKLLATQAPGPQRPVQVG